MLAVRYINKSRFTLYPGAVLVSRIWYSLSPDSGPKTKNMVFFVPTPDCGRKPLETLGDCSWKPLETVGSCKNGAESTTTACVFDSVWPKRVSVACPKAKAPKPLAFSRNLCPKRFKFLPKKLLLVHQSTKKLCFCTTFFQNFHTYPRKFYFCFTKTKTRPAHTTPTHHTTPHHTHHTHTPHTHHTHTPHHTHTHTPHHTHTHHTTHTPHTHTHP